METPDIKGLNDAKFHPIAMDIVLGGNPEINDLHIKYLVEDEKYKFLPNSVQLAILQDIFPEEVAEAKRLAKESLSSQG